jgi:hypothetical protein
MLDFKVLQHFGRGRISPSPVPSRILLEQHGRRVGDQSDDLLPSEPLDRVLPQMLLEILDHAGPQHGLCASLKFCKMQAHLEKQGSRA